MLLNVALTAFAQISPDSNNVLIPKADAVKVLRGALQGKVYKEQRDSLQRDITTLNKLIEIKSLQIANLNTQASDYKQIVLKYDQQIKVMNEQRQLLQSQVDNLNKLYRKERRKNILWKISTIIGIGAGVFLGTKI